MLCQTGVSAEEERRWSECRDHALMSIMRSLVHNELPLKLRSGRDAAILKMQWSKAGLVNEILNEKSLSHVTVHCVTVTASNRCALRLQHKTSDPDMLILSAVSRGATRQGMLGHGIRSACTTTLGKALCL